MNIYVNCGGRSIINGGYGEYSRGIISGLSSLKEVKVYVRDDILKKIAPSSIYNEEVINKNILPLSTKRNKIDIECVICSLTSIPTVDKLSIYGKKVLITGSPFLGLSSDISKIISNYDAVFYSGVIDSSNFSDVLSYNLPQPIDFTRFYQHDNSDCKSASADLIRYLFIGTFNYWKGVDIAVNAFVKSNISTSSELYIKCGISKLVGLSSDEAVNFVKHMELYVSCVAQYIKKAGFSATYNIVNSSRWDILISSSNSEDQKYKKIVLDFSYSNYNQMNELYSKCNIFLSTSRGETWSMPVIESLYNGLFVIIGEHIGCSEYIKSLSSSVKIVGSEKNHSKIILFQIVLQVEGELIVTMEYSTLSVTS